VISPLIARDPFMGYGHFDDPVDLLPVLVKKIELQMRYLFLRLAGLGRYARKLELTLFCEYSQKSYLICVEPVSPSRDSKLFEDLLVQKISQIDLQNPIIEFEIQIVDVPEKVQQLDFFQPRDTSEDRWRRLISFAQQAEIEMGFLQIEPSHLPETSYSFKSEWPEKFSPKNLVEWSGQAIQVKSVYAKDLMNSPRPTLLLRHALPLSKFLLSTFRMLTRFPTERIESGWWQNSHERDYYFALSNKGQLLWIYQELKSQKYFLQGYFD
jgi:protein ImuB